MKKKEYSKAKPLLEEIRNMFYNSQPGELPAAFNKLAEIELSKIPASQEQAGGTNTSGTTKTAPETN
jgi:hypothetical protein